MACEGTFRARCDPTTTPQTAPGRPARPVAALAAASFLSLLPPVFAAAPAAAPDAPAREGAEVVRMERGQPRQNLNLALRWEPSSSWSTNLRFVRYGEVTASATDNSGWAQARIDALTPGYDVSYAPAVPSINASGAAVPTTQRQVLQTFGAKWVTDLEVTYRMGRRLTVSVGANNLLDVYPTTNIRSTAAFQGSDNAGIFPYNGISPFGFNGAFYYTKVALRF